MCLFVLTVTGEPSHADEHDVYLSLAVLGAIPADRDLFSQGSTVSNAKIGHGIGAALKVAVFPAVLKRLVGLELESNGHGSDIAFSVQTGAGTTAARTNLWVFNSMINLIVRYPGHRIIPYIGVGGGVSQGVLTRADIPGRADQDFESSTTLGHQFLAGIQGDLTKKLFLFGEYKYVSANYHWERLTLDYRAQYALAGVGLRF
ncbi:MAG: outer membrane beta-barrel protein [Nitrospiraceae bacterium]